jgi:hypothetical protein
MVWLMPLLANSFFFLCLRRRGGGGAQDASWMDPQPKTSGTGFTTSFTHNVLMCCFLVRHHGYVSQLEAGPYTSIPDYHPTALHILFMEFICTNPNQCLHSSPYTFNRASSSMSLTSAALRQPPVGPPLAAAPRSKTS